MTAPNPSSLVAPIRVPAGTTAGTAVREAGLPGKGEDAIVVVRVDGALKDLSWTPESDTEVEPVAANTEDGRSVIRHSAAHVLAQAVQELFPQAKLGIGPPITDGFYYDFGIDHAFTPEDLTALEKKMKQIIKEGQRFSRRVYKSVEEPRPSSPTSRSSWNWCRTSPGPKTRRSWRSAATSYPPTTT
ncbi:Threonyl-tRNA synthetase [Mycobacteroides abscessus]|nr:Threonyl-tRNA synthetase [Mycobacteroides abscessus]